MRFMPFSVFTAPAARPFKLPRRQRNDPRNHEPETVFVSVRVTSWIDYLRDGDDAL
jgi:hypothetical protein